jgi:hypothetical protein
MSGLSIVLIVIGALVLLGGMLVLGGLMAGGRRMESLEQDLLRPGKIDGVIALSGLPPHRGLILTVCFYEVGSLDAPVPFDGRPPADAVRDAVKVLDDVDLEKESTATSRDHPFSLEHPVGYFYVEVRAILFRKRDENLVAQAEQFFYSKRPLRIREANNMSMTYPVVWPADSAERLKAFGVVKPQTPPLPESPA